MHSFQLPYLLPPDRTSLPLVGTCVSLVIPYVPEIRWQVELESVLCKVLPLCRSERVDGKGMQGPVVLVPGICCPLTEPHYRLLVHVFLW
jgi:hypothetical protein